MGGPYELCVLALEVVTLVGKPQWAGIYPATPSNRTELGETTNTDAAQSKYGTMTIYKTMDTFYGRDVYIFSFKVNKRAFD